MEKDTNKKRRKRKKASVDTGRCVGCGACESVCPKAAVKVWKGCYAKADEALCVGCGKCAGTCPAGCIEMKEVEHDAE